MHDSDTSVNSARADVVADRHGADTRNWWVYLLACRNKRTYVGVALDVAARFQLHVCGRGAKFTRANQPIAILGAQAFASRSDAQKAEYALKQLSKSKKLAWAMRFSFASGKPKRSFRASTRKGSRD